ncbi:unnamed protein product, partial [Choristocarpus tenellus]
MPPGEPVSRCQATAIGKEQESDEGTQLGEALNQARTCLEGGQWKSSREAFAVLGKGRFSTVVRARRRLPSVAGGDEPRVCALKIVSKKAFWKLVVEGRERSDTLSRELLCQTILTAKTAVTQSAPSAVIPEGIGDDHDIGHDGRGEIESSPGRETRG